MHIFTPRARALKPNSYVLALLLALLTFGLALAEGFAR